MLVFEDTKPTDEKLLFYSHTIEWKNGLPVPHKADATAIKISDIWEEPLKAECSAFLKAVETGNEPLTSGKEGLRVLKVLKKCQTSIELQAKNPKLQDEVKNLQYYAHPTAVVDNGAQIGKGTKIWHFSHIYKGAEIGENCVIGQNVSIADGVKMGNNIKIQNNVSIYTGAIVEDDVFFGPSCVLTNVTNPRSQVLRHSLYEKTFFKRGTTIGANATVVCGITLGRYSFIAAGAVVAKDVPDYALMMGVPAKQKGWMSRHGHILKNPDKSGVMVCPESGYKYKEVKPGVLKCLDLDEEQPLPEEKRVGQKTYDEFK
jgi:UDP-2-acetamido-3-amino-2,3-dideoxy-glucuronate N-acetyltransferase